MSIRELTDPEAVRSAMAEFDRLGRDAFLGEHGYQRARRYFLRAPGGKLYDSKAIAGIAYGYQFPDRGPLRSANFSGGEATVKAQLERLSFEVIESDESGVHGQEGRPRNPAWIRDELILALDLYVRLAGHRFAHDSVEIVECSALLNQLQRLLGTTQSGTLRNPNGVYMKLMNFRRFDPAFTSAGRRGSREATGLRRRFGRPSIQIPYDLQVLRRPFATTSRQQLAKERTAYRRQTMTPRMTLRLPRVES